MLSVAAQTIGVQRRARFLSAGFLAFLCLSALPVSAEVYHVTATTSDAVDFTGAPPGSVVLLHAHTRAKLRLMNLQGTVANPIIITNTGGQFIIDNQSTTDNFGLEFWNCKNIVVHGTPQPGSYDYGIKVSRMVAPGSSGLQFVQGTTDFEVFNVEVTNVSYAGLVAKSDNLTSAQFLMQNIRIHDCYFHDTFDGEGMYIGSSFFETQDPHHVNNLEVYHNWTENTGRDGIQVGCGTSGVSVHDNVIIGYGYVTTDYTQNQGIRINTGTAAQVYNNWIESRPGLGVGPGYGIFANPYDDSAFYNNVIINPGQDGILIADTGNNRQVAGATVSTFNNTIINPGGNGITYWTSATTGNVVANNLVLHPGLQYFNRQIAGMSITESNNLYLPTVAAAGLVDTVGGDYHMSPTSPAINVGLDVSAYGVTFDFDSQARPKLGAFDVGAYESATAAANRAPLVSAGYDQSVSLPSLGTLTGAVTDDGAAPGNATPTCLWTKVSGPGTVTFTNANAASTTATFSAAGAYVLRLTGNDGVLTTSDDVNVMVVAATGSDLILFDFGTITSTGNWNNVATATAGAKITNAVASDGSSSGIALDITAPFDGTRGGGSSSGSGVYPANAMADSCWLQSWAGHDVIAKVKLKNLSASTSYALTFFTSQMGSGSQISRYTVNGQSLTLDALDNSTVTRTLSHLKPAADGTLEVEIRNNVGVGYAQLNVLEVRRVTQANTAPIVLAGASQTIYVPYAASLTGSVTDDGLAPGNATTTCTWSKVSGPGTVSFTNGNAAVTTATFSATGTYVLRLTGSDGALNATHDTTVVVNSGMNRAPQVDAGYDQFIFLPATVNLAGAVTDDGLAPGNGTTTRTWTKFRGPGTVNFGSANALNTTASFSAPGIYELRLTASDGILSSYDDVTVSVASPTTLSKIVRFDFGTILTPWNWNNVTTVTSGVKVTNAINADGFPTSLGLSVTAPFEAITGAGSTSTTGVYPANAMQDSFYVQTTTVGKVKVTGLTVGNQYKLHFFASRMTAGVRVTQYKVGTQTVTLDATDNTSTVVYLNASPAGDGTIEVEVKSNPGNGYGYLGVLIVESLSVNQPPVVMAGSDQAVSLSAGASLSGSVTDDGMAPGNPTPTAAWTKFSGPGTVTFGNANTAVTTATFSVAGTYVLRLTGSDGVLSTTDDVQITVNAPTSVLFDFGTTTTAGNWNNVTTATVGTKITNAVTSTGGSTTIGLDITAPFIGATVGGSTSGSGAYPANAMVDSFYQQSWAGNDVIAKVKLTGLNPSTTYSLSFFASKLVSGSRAAQYKVGTSTTTLEALDNVTTIATIPGLVPAADGTMEVEVKNTVTAGYFHLGVIELKW